MTASKWNAGRPAGSRERIIRLLLKRRSTVESLASELGVTKNAVRAQIALLQREGAVEVQGEVKGARRPAAVYGVRPGADVHSSKAYQVVLPGLIRVLADKLDQGEFRTVMRELGRRLAGSVPRPSGSPRERVRAALDFLKTLGSDAEMTEKGGTVVISSYGCPISAAVAADARSCIAMEALLKELTGLRVTEKCSHGEQPRCRFEINMNK
ncbi:MAG TPA: HTH domain-containing protein [Nitrospirota bacterium]|nr:HTH domain-containing protein [Nitrospirota bacterium]